MTPYDDEVTFLRSLRRQFFWLIFALLLIIGGATVISRAFDLAWFPWDIQMKTGMIRASNSYITTQQTALRTLFAGYEGAAPAQQRAIVLQMREIADTIPGYVQPDVAAFLGGSPR